MDLFYDIWNAATFKRSSCGSNIVVIVGLISMMIFGACTATKMMLCSQTESMPCVLYGETRKVCPGDRVYTNTTLRVDPNIIPQNISIWVKEFQFSKGPVVSGTYHNKGDEHNGRWINKISFQGNTMTFEIVNLEIKSVDEFECHMEIDIEGEKFISEHFIWFRVHSDNCPTNPPCIKDTTEQYLHNITKQLDQLTVLLMNSSASDMAEQKKMNIHFLNLLSQIANNTEGSVQRAEMREGLEDVKTKLDTQNKMDIALVVLVLVLIISLVITAKIFIPERVQKDLQDKFSGLLNHIRCNKLPSSNTSDRSTVRSQSSSSLASMNQDEPSPNKEANRIDLSMSSSEDELHFRGKS